MPVKRKIKVGITMGDPSGVGPAVTIKATSKLRGLADFVVIGDRTVLRKVSQLASLPVSQFRLVDLGNVGRYRFKFGCIRAEYGKASIEYLDKALGLLKNKEIECLVTAPICKEAINLAGFHYGGHTEYLSEKTKRDVEMMLLNNKLKTILVTRHIPLSKVPLCLTKERLNSVIMAAFDSLRKMFLLRNPRIVVCGLNPHASDNGVIGREEVKVMVPALNKLRKKINNLEGPLSADSAILATAEGKYDCAVVMYHDQALIPLKLGGFEKGVNLSLGLGFVRTSPLHGTAFDIAEKIKAANPSSMIAAIETAVKCTLNLRKS